MSEKYCLAGIERKCNINDCSSFNACDFRSASLKEPCSDPLPVQQPPDTPYPKPTINYDGDSTNVACYKLGYNVGFNMGLDRAIKQVKHFAYVSGLTDEEMLIAAITACKVKE